MKIKEILISFSIMAVLVVFMAVVSVEGLERHLRVECYNWQKLEKNFPCFELQEREVEMCKELGVNIK